jgi:hypothetical protein
VSAVRTAGTGGRIRDALEPIGRTLFAEPFEQGRIRLDGVPGVERTMAAGALLVLGGLLLALLVGDAFRHSTLLQLNDVGNRWSFVPLTLLPMAVVALFVGWLAFLWGALRGPVWVALTGVFVHLLINGSIGDVSGGIGDTWVARNGPTINRVGYFATAGVMVVFALINLRPSWRRPARFAALPLLAAALAALYGSVLLMAIEAFQHGFPAQATLSLDGNVEGISAMLQPVILLAVVALIDFSYNFANAVTAPALEIRATAVKVGLAVLIVVKLALQLGPRLDDWATYVRISMAGVVWVVGSAVALAAIGLWWRASLRRRAVGEAGEERVKEGIVYLGIVAEILPAFVVIVLTTAASTLAAQLNSLDAVRFLDSVARFTFRHSGIVRTIPWALLLALGIWLLARARTGARRELGLGLVLLGAWNTPFYALAAAGIRFQYSNPLLDIVLTLGIAVVLAARWRHIDRFEAVALSVVTVFAWLAFSRGDFISAIVNGPLWFLGLSGSVVVVFGIVYTLLADSAVASGSSPRFPRDSRLLLYLGFLVLSTAVLAWIQITHPTSNIQATVSSNGFADIGIPFAAWLVIRRPMTRREAADTALPSEAAAFEIDDREPPPAFQP